MLKLKYFVAISGFLLLTGAGPPQTHKSLVLNDLKYPLSNTNYASAVGISLMGPCAGFTYHNPGETRSEEIVADYKIIKLRPSVYKFQREELAISDCPNTQGLNITIGELFNPKTSFNAATPYASVGYTVNLGTWTVTSGFGIIVQEKYNHKHLNILSIFHWGPVFPYFGIQAETKFWSP